MTIRAAVLGYGRSGSTMHAGGIAGNDAFIMAAVCDIDSERRKQARERFGCPVYDDYRAMLEAEELDLVCIVTRNDQHCQMTCDCLDAGTNVLVTKPWAANAHEAERMIAAAERSGRKLMPWLPARWGCDLRRLDELIRVGTIGKVFMLRRTVNSFATRCDWQTEKKFAGGYLLNWGPHIIDPPLVLLGSKPVKVYGHMMQTVNPGDVEDLFIAAITLADGSLVIAEYTIAVEPMPSWIIQGDLGTITIYGKNMKIHRSMPQCPADPTKFATMQAHEDTVLEETLQGNLYGDTDEIYAAIAAAVQDQAEFAVTSKSALELSRVFDAVRKSHQEQAVVSLM